MHQRKILLPLIIILSAQLLFAFAPNKSDSYKGKAMTNTPIPDPNFEAVMPDGLGPVSRSMNTDDPIGELFQFGTTWYDIQHNGTCGRQLQVDGDGYVHLAWMNGLNNGASLRHVYYQLLDPMDQLLFTGGIQVDQSPRAGYTVMELYSDNRAMPCFHQHSINENFHSALAFDYFPRVGAFQTQELPWVYEGGNDLEIDWPRMDIDINDKLHIVSTENPASGVAGDPQRLYYCRAAYDPYSYSIEFETPEQEEITWTMTISPDVAASPVSDKVAIGWMQMCATEPDTGQYDNDVILCISEDGINWDWTDTINVTQWIPPDESYLPDTTMANQDTLRAYTDMCVYIDYNDVVHVFFSVIGYYALENTLTYGNGYIYHWDEVNQVYSMVANGWFENGNYDPGAWNRYAQRPSAATDPETGDMYCMYQRYFDPLGYSSTLPFPYMEGDETDFSAAGYPNGEIWMTKSTDSGYSWAEGINITDTHSPNAYAGDCLSELTPSMAPQIINDQCHIFYILDKDAGAVVQDEGTWTLNDAVYHRIALENIPSTPLLPPYPMHVDSTGMPGGTPPPPQGWELQITATGETGTAPNEFNVIIGGDDNQNFLPAPPPPPQYMAWPQLWELPAWNGPYSEMIQIWDESNEYEWTMEIDPNGNVMPPDSRTTVLTWDPADLPDVPENWGFMITDDSGNILIPDMSLQSSLEVTGSSNTFLHVRYGQLILPFEYNLAQYWNLISLPVTPEDNSLASLFPNATVAYEFSGGTYIQADSLDNGKAYWLYVPNAETLIVEGLPFTEYSVQVTPPWEMLGSVSEPAIPTVDPGNIVVLYNFDQTYYQVPGFVMEPGFGYWVNMTGDAEEFSLSGTLFDGSAKVEETEMVKETTSLDDWEMALNLNNDANSFNLTIGNSETADNIPAPPAPPQYSVWGELYEPDWSAGPYFSMIQPSGTDISTWLITIDPNGNANPQASGLAVLSWDAGSIPAQGLLSLVNSNGGVVIEDMRDVESFEISGSETVQYEIVFNTTLGIGSPKDAIPADYTLYQNAPNPFNPVTQIKYYLLETGKVKVTVFNIMGEEVAVLADGVQNQGFHIVNFEAANLTSGVYFYRIEAGDFTDLKKMVLIK